MLMRKLALISGYAGRCLAWSVHRNLPKAEEVGRSASCFIRTNDPQTKCESDPSQRMLHRILSRHSRLRSTSRLFTRQISTPSKSKPSNAASPNSSSKTTTTPKTDPSISLKSINAFVVSQSSAGGSKNRIPPKLPADRLSPEYRSKARKITLAIIAAPIAIVLSYILAMRTWGGRERSVSVRSEVDGNN